MQLLPGLNPQLNGARFEPPLTSDSIFPMLADFPALHLLAGVGCLVLDSLLASALNGVTHIIINLNRCLPKALVTLYLNQSFIPLQQARSPTLKALKSQLSIARDLPEMAPCFSQK